jgi:hypothetical protein
MTTPAPSPIVIPGVGVPPLALAILSVLGSIVTEIVNFQWISGTTANVIVGIAGIVVPLAVYAYDIYLRQTAASVVSSALESGAAIGSVVHS